MFFNDCSNLRAYLETPNGTISFGLHITLIVGSIFIRLSDRSEVHLFVDCLQMVLKVCCCGLYHSLVLSNHVEADFSCSPSNISG